MAIDETGGMHGVREHHAILSLAALPRQKVFGKELYPTIFEKAAVYARSIISGHPFLDGNKRSAMLCASIFLEDNGHKITAPKGSIEKFALKIISKKLDIPQISKWFKDNSQQNKTT